MNSKEVAASVLFLVYSGRKCVSSHVYESEMTILLKGTVFKSSLTSFVFRWV